MTKESFGNWFREICQEAGCPGSAHGLRKALATRLADEGATTHELEALFGWRGGGMASLYTRKANRSKLAGSAMDKLSNERGLDLDANVGVRADLPRGGVDSVEIRSARSPRKLAWSRRAPAAYPSASNFP